MPRAHLKSSLETSNGELNLTTNQQAQLDQRDPSLYEKNR